MRFTFHAELCLLAFQVWMLQVLIPNKYHTLLIHKPHLVERITFTNEDFFLGSEVG